MCAEGNEYLKWPGTFSLVSERQKHLSPQPPSPSPSRLASSRSLLSGGSMNSVLARNKSGTDSYCLSFREDEKRNEPVCAPRTFARKQRSSSVGRNDPSERYALSRVSCPSFVTCLFAHNGKRNQLPLLSQRTRS